MSNSTEMGGIPLPLTVNQIRDKIKIMESRIIEAVHSFYAETGVEVKAMIVWNVKLQEVKITYSNPLDNSSSLSIFQIKQWRKSLEDLIENALNEFYTSTEIAVGASIDRRQVGGVWKHTMQSNYANPLDDRK